MGVVILVNTASYCSKRCYLEFLHQSNAAKKKKRDLVLHIGDFGLYDVLFDWSNIEVRQFPRVHILFVTN